MPKRPAGIPVTLPLDARSGATLQRQVYDGLRAAILAARLRPVRPGWPALDQVPLDLWWRLAMRVGRRLGRELLGHGDPAGYPPLRKAIAEYVAVSRGVRCAAEQVVVTAGSQQALFVAAQVLLDPDDAAWVEDPAYPGTVNALRAAGRGWCRSP